MKKTIKALLTICSMALCLTFLLTGCEWFVKDCEHTYDNACDATCNECGEERAITHTPAEDDGDCTTQVLCDICEWVVVKGNENHTPEEDDGDCTTAITCIDCGMVTTPARENHTGGKATATELAICEACSQPYGELAIPKITGVVIKNTDSPQYNAETKTFTIKANGTGDLPVLEANGENFDSLSHFDSLDVTWMVWYANGDTNNLTSNWWIIEGNTATLEIPSDWRSNFKTEPFEIQYTNDDGATWIPTGYYVVMEDGNITNADELQAAILAGGTVKLTQDLVLSHNIVIDSAVDVTLDLNGFSITETGTGYGLFSLVNADATLTITGEGTLSANGTVPLYVDEGALIIEHGVTVDGRAYYEYNNWYVIVNVMGRVVINGGSFISGTELAVECAESTAACEINGGSFTSDPGAYVNAETHKVVENDDGTLSVMPKSIDGADSILYLDVNAVISSEPWTSGINVFFYDSDGVAVGWAGGTLADGVYTITDIPDGAAKLEFFDLYEGNNTAIMDVEEGCNMFVLDGNTDDEGKYTGTWTTYNP